MKKLYKLSLFIILWILSIPILYAQYQPITTVVGNGETSYADDGIEATAMRLGSVFNLVVDTDGNYYFSDPVAEKVFMIDVETNTVVTIAGNGEYGYSGDGGPAKEAMLANPTGLALDSSGDLYIADSWNQRIRKVNMSTGIISTIAGTGDIDVSIANTAALETDMFYPTGLAFDADGNLYYTDQGSHRIRKLDATTSIISTVAGGGNNGYESGDAGDGGPAIDALLLFPRNIKIDGSGNIYFADTENHKIRKIDGTTGIISTIAGTGEAGYSNPTLATSAQLDFPTGLALTDDGYLYFSDNNNQRIRRIFLPSSQISDVAGTGTIGFSGDGGAAATAELNYPQGLAINADGNILVADSRNARVRLINRTTNTISTAAGGGALFSGDGGPAVDAQINFSYGTAVDADGNIYVADYLNNRIRKVDATTGIINTIAGTGVRGFSGDGGPAESAELNRPFDISIDASGNIYFSDLNNHRIRKIDATTGIINTIAGSGVDTHSGENIDAVSAGTPYPSAITIDDAGNVYFAEYLNHYIRKINGSTGKISTIAGNGVGAYSGDGGLATAASLNRPSGLALDINNNIYISDSRNNRVRKINSSSGIISTILGNGSLTADGELAAESSAQAVGGVAVDHDGHVYVAVTGTDKVRRISARTGRITTIAGLDEPGFNGEQSESRLALLNTPWGLALDDEENLYIADVGNRRIRKVIADKTAPKGYTASIVEEIIGANIDIVTYNVNGVESNAIIKSELTDRNGVSLSQEFKAGTDTDYQLTFEGISNLADGDLTLSVRLIDAMDNIGKVVTASTIKDTNPPSGFSVSFDQDQIDATNAENISFTFASAEVGTTYSYSIVSSAANASSPIEDTGSITSPNQQVSNLDLSIFSKGTLTLTVTLEDQAGNSSSPEIATVEKVNKLSQSIQYNTLEELKYGDNVYTLNALASSGLPVTYSLGTMDPDRPIVSLSEDKLTILNAGSVEITSNQSGNEIYNAAEPYIFTINVKKAELSVSAENNSKIYGQENPQFSLSYQGFVNEDDTSVLDQKPTASVINQDGAGKFTIKVDGGEDDNYSFAYVEGVLTVNKALLTIRAEDKERTVDEQNPDFTLNYEGFVYGEDATILDVLPTVNTTADSSSEPGVYDIIVSGAEDNNYNFNYVSGILTIVDEAVLAARNFEEINISLYPVPLHEELNIVLPPNWKKARVRIINKLGEVIHSEEMISNEKIDVSKLTSGMYVIQLQNGNQIKSRKVLK